MQVSLICSVFMVVVKFFQWGRCELDLFFFHGEESSSVDVKMANLFSIGRIVAFQGERDGSFIISANDGFLYHKHHDREGSRFVSLRCVRWKKKKLSARCNGRAVVSRDGFHYWITQHHSSHVADPSCMEERWLRKLIILRVMTGDTTPFFQIVREEGQR